MITRVFSVIISFVMAVSGFRGGLLCEIRDAVLGAFLGIPSTRSDVNDGFLDELTDSDVRAVGDSGYLKNMLIVFIDEAASVADKYRLLAENSAVLLGWFCAADLYVISCAAPDYSELLSKSHRLEENELVHYAGPITAKKIFGQGTPSDPFEGAGTAWDELAPSGDNWWLEAIYARQAWDYSEYFSHINIGIVDSGFDTRHEDLAEKIVFPSARDAIRNIPEGHGTHVAGIIGARHNNGVGISGICDNSTLVCVDWMAGENQYWISDLHILFGLCATVASGAKVVNFSLGSSGSIKGEKSTVPELTMRFDAALYSAAISVLLGRGYDFICVQSAGNGNEESYAVDSYYNGTFCAINENTAISIVPGVSKQDIADRIIVVACAANGTNGNYHASSFSNVGSGVSVAAPGSRVYSCDYDPENDRAYGYKSGTSMAAPAATAIAALAWSVNPEFTGAQVKELVCSEENSAATVVSYDEPHFEHLNYVDYPLINAKLSVEAALCRTYSMGRVEGRLCDGEGNPVEGTVEISRDGKTESHTSFSDGTFSFVTLTGDVTLTALDLDGAELLQKAITVTQNETLSLNELIPPQAEEAIAQE